MSHRRLIAALPVAALLASFGYASVLGGSASAREVSASTPTQAKMVKVKVTENSSGLFFFSPKKVSIKRGSTVVWTNSGTTTHTVTSNNGKFKSKNLPGKSQVKITFKKVGTYKYHCIFHSSMIGNIVVHK